MRGHPTCSFCGKPEVSVQWVYRGPRDLICNECVRLCVEIFSESTSGRRTSARKDTLSCSFCGKTEDEVQRLVAGPTVFICDGCVAGIEMRPLA